jgi:hypothetical protein
LPGAIGQQVPTRFGRAHETQLPSQATLQHAPSAQKPLAQSEPLLQLATSLLKPHAPFTHAELKQSASLAHVVWHVPVAASHANGAHGYEGIGGIRHAPLPSHRTAWTAMFPLHCAGKQIVLVGSGAQMPSLPGSAQLRQFPSHAEVQHTPFAQTPLAQSIRSAHGAPITLRSGAVPLSG